MDSLISRRDLEFLLYEWLDVESLTKRPRFQAHGRDSFDAVLDLSRELATELFAPHNKAADANEPRLEDGRVRMLPEVTSAVRAFAEAGLVGASMSEDVGGQQLPRVVAGACMALFQAANAGTTSYPFLSIANANLLLAHGSPEQIERFVRPMVEGRFSGTMCLSEPQAGSSLAGVATRAIEADDETYRLFGNKMWISGGDHELTDNIVHLVLARILGGPAGVRGLSLFIVPKYVVESDGTLGARNDVVVAGLNHKMGYRGTVNTVLNFGEGTHRPGGAPGAVGYLVGEPHRGLAYMFHMMNEMRVGVGLGAAALGYTAYLKAVEYARTRPQGRRTGSSDDTQVPIIQHADVRRMLLAQKSYVEGALALNLYCGRLIDEEQTTTDAESRERARLLLEVLTPIAKSWPSQWCLRANSLAIQVHGGYGYTREYDVEQHYRDNRLNAIHEGTHGIQGIDLLGRKVVMEDGAAFRALRSLLAESVLASARCGGELAGFGAQLQSALDRLVTVTDQVWAAGDLEATLANSSIYLEVVGHVVLAWIWLEQGLAASDQVGDFYDGKRQAGRYFFRYELPRVGAQLDLLAARDRTTLDMADSWF
jgi:butyryl-CoA dehydrogenase